MDCLVNDRSKSADSLMEGYKQAEICPSVINKRSFRASFTPCRGFTLVLSGRCRMEA
jgi:hypothetical protein